MKTMSKAYRTVNGGLFNFGAPPQHFLPPLLLSAYISCPYDFFSRVNGLATPWTNIRAAELLSKLGCVGVIGGPVLLRPAFKRHSTHQSEDEHWQWFPTKFKFRDLTKHKISCFEECSCCSFPFNESGKGPRAVKLNKKGKKKTIL